MGTTEMAHHFLRPTMTCGCLVILPDLTGVMPFLVPRVVVVSTSTLPVILRPHHVIALPREERSSHWRILKSTLVLRRTAVVTLVPTSPSLRLLLAISLTASL